MNRDNSYLLGNKWAVGSGPNRTSFKPGDSPWNKGVTGYMGANRTSFKAGVPSGRGVPIGTIQQRTRRGRTRNWIKISEYTDPQRYAPLGWMEYAKYVWIAECGFLRDGDVVHHINGDSTDDCPENLIALSRADHPRIHNRYGLHPIPDDLLKAIGIIYPLYSSVPAAVTSAQLRLVV